MITKGYLKQQNELHSKTGYGSSGHYWLGHVLELAELTKAKTVLDYGCGKGTLGNYLHKYSDLKCTNYDPSTFPEKPGGTFDLVACLDVLEHIEPKQIARVLDDIRDRVGAGKVFAVISTRPATKFLDDGRNAHVLLRNYIWWKSILQGNFKMSRVRQFEGGFEVILSKKIEK